MEISPSILNAKKLKLKDLEKVCKRVHIDVMDGKFVKNTTRFSPVWVKKHKTKLIKDVHLMTLNPERQIINYKKAGAKVINFHVEIGKTEKLIQLCKKNKLKISLALNPKTSVKKIKPFLKDIDEVLVMSVNPGKGGQRFIKSSLKKIREIRKLTSKTIKVDGGLNDKNIPKIKKAGANIAAVGSYLWEDPIKRIKELKKI